LPSVNPQKVLPVLRLTEANHETPVNAIRDYLDLPGKKVFPVDPNNLSLSN
jgi:hypothetical protein